MHVTQQVYFEFNKERRNYTKDAKNTNITMIKPESVLTFYQALPTEAFSFWKILTPLHRIKGSAKY